MSLRDVERAMIVFEYFYERMNLFAPLMNKKAKNERAEKIRVVSGEEVRQLSDNLIIYPIDQYIYSVGHCYQLV